MAVQSTTSHKITLQIKLNYYIEGIKIQETKEEDGLTTFVITPSFYGY
jgi:hypothetical protein